MEWNTETANEFGHKNGELAASVALSEVESYVNDPESVDVESLNEYVEEEASHGEVNQRQYGGFQNSFASEVNSMEESKAEAIWEAYEEGVQQGIESDRKYRLQELKEKYGEEG